MEKDNKLFLIIRKIFQFFVELINKIEKLDPASNIKQRILSSVVMLFFAVYAIFFSVKLFSFFIIACSIIMTIEWLNISKNMEDQKKWRIIGFFYISIPLYSVYELRLINPHLLFWMFAIIWSTDIFAFFAGKIIGGKKIAPSISPGKTYSGLLGGVLASALIGFISSLFFAGGSLFFIFISVFLSILEQFSDLLESKFKRIFGVKDSGNIIPGHGGLLDRLDGITLTAPLTLFIVTFFADKFI